MLKYIPKLGCMRVANSDHGVSVAAGPLVIASTTGDLVVVVVTPLSDPEVVDQNPIVHH